jgi:amino-acid N-acetyltransferase
MKGRKKVLSNIVAMPIATNPITTRRAEHSDAGHIAALVNLGVSEGQLLPRTPEMIAASIEDWVVAESGTLIIGIGSLLQMTPALAEVRSLVVAPDFRKYGVGGRIVDELVEETRSRGIPTVFALTRAVEFFERHGFTQTAKENFPEKVWRDCVFCPVRFNCDETAMVKKLR